MPIRHQSKSILTGILSPKDKKSLSGKAYQTEKAIFPLCNYRVLFPPILAVRLNIFPVFLYPLFLNPFVLLASTVSCSSEFHNLTQTEVVLVLILLAGNFIACSSFVLSEIIAPHPTLLCDFIDFYYNSLSSLLYKPKSPRQRSFSSYGSFARQLHCSLLYLFRCHYKPS